MDFCFGDGEAMLVVAGWSSDHWLDLELYIDETRLAPRLVTRHARRDLRTAERFGVLAVFDLAGIDMAGNATVHVKSGQEFTEIQPERLVTTSSAWSRSAWTSCSSPGCACWRRAS